MPTQSQRACAETTTSAIKQCLSRALSSIRTRTIDFGVEGAANAIRAERADYMGIDLSTPNLARLLAEVITGNDHGTPWHWHAGTSDRDRTAEVHGRENRAQMLYLWADGELTLQSEAAKLMGEGHRARQIIEGDDPVLDAQGNEMPETTPAETLAAWQARQTLYNTFLCHFFSSETTIALLKSRIAAVVPHALSSDLGTAKQQLLSRFDRAVRVRLEYLFDGETVPANEQQAAVRDAIAKERQGLVRSIRTAATAADAEAATSTSTNAINRLYVADAPTWDRDGEPLSGFPAMTHSSTYTTGSTPWTLALHAHTSASSDAISKAAGDCLLDDWTHPHFEIANVTVDAAGGDLNFIVRRKTGATGHPPSGDYSLYFTARNYRGPTILTVIVTVP